jgi:GrpB-like predicted nucleotidyltransferase (UPF0157 family)
MSSASRTSTFLGDSTVQAIHPFTSADEATPYTVQYHPYDADLPAVFARLKHLVRRATGARVVEHVGSTAIPGVGGRNALDIALPVDDAQRQCMHSALLALGFQDSPFPHYLPLLVGRFRWRGRAYPVLLYLVAPQSGVYEAWLKFREHMRANPADARAYDAVKRQAAAAGPVDGEDYQAAKTPFLAAMASRL